MSTLETSLPPYINGRFLAVNKPERIFTTLNPVRPNDILAITGWNKELVSLIIEGMLSAQKNFQKKSLQARLAIVGNIISFIRDNADEIKSKMMLESGRTRIGVEEEWRLCEKLFLILPKFCNNILGEQKVEEGWLWSYAPVGLVLVSNTVALPVYSLLSMVLPALVAGNAVTIKASLHCPLSVSLIASCIHQAQVPAGLVQVLYGDFEVYRRLLLSHEFAAIGYTGGEELREQVRKDVSTHSKTRLLMCNIGKNAAYIGSGFRLEDNIQKVLYGMCVDSGQRLESTSLVFVKKALLESFCEAFTLAVKQMPISTKDEFSNSELLSMGPLCSNEARERFLRFQGIAYRESDETFRWGKSIDNPGNGYFVSPGVHLISLEKALKSVYANSAFFGPDVAIIPIEELEEAILFVNSLEHCHVFSALGCTQQEVDYIRTNSVVPMVSANSPTTTLEPSINISEKGSVEESRHSGLSFIFSTVRARILNVSGQMHEGNSLFQSLILLVGIFLCFFLVHPAQAEYKKSVEGSEVVKNKLYPKIGRIQVNGLQGGMILNQSFIDTYFANVGVTYHFDEWNAINVEGFFGFSQDRWQRNCIENFYFDTKRANNQRAKEGLSSNVCDLDNLTPANYPSPATEKPPEGWEENNQETWADATKARGPYQRRPAYMNIRQIDQILAVNYQWTPVYGKALWFLSSTGYMDFFLNGGLGVTFSTYWERQQLTRSGRDILKEGASLTSDYGINGRPDSSKQVSPLLSLGAGSRFYFMKSYVLNTEFRNFTVLGGGDGGIMNFFGLWGGLGMFF